MTPSKNLLIITSLNLFFSLISCSEISSKFHEFQLVPEVTPSAPDELLQVIYPDNNAAHLGNEIPPSVAKNPPKLYWKAKPALLYLFTMIDPDYPGPGIPQYFHWIIGNVPGNDYSRGELLESYVNPQPPPKKGPHRYTFLIFKQPGHINYDHKNLFKLGNRTHPSLKKALEDYGIDNHPLFGNFFLSEKS